jgi:hypothetical protein
MAGQYLMPHNYHLALHFCIKNTFPCSGGNGETFVSMTMNHRSQGESPSIKVFECTQKFYKYLHKADPTATINPLYDKE